MNLTQPPKYCRKCGSLIPANNEALPGQRVPKVPQLGCAACLEKALPSNPKKKNPPSEQSSFFALPRDPEKS
jgi:hypothetical protein